MQFRLIHGTVAIIGDRAAVSDIAILSELVRYFFRCGHFFSLPIPSPPSSTAVLVSDLGSLLHDLRRP